MSDTLEPFICPGCDALCGPCGGDEPESPYGIMFSDNDGPWRAATGAEAMAWADTVVADGTLPEHHPAIVKIRETYAAELAAAE